MLFTSIHIASLFQIQKKCPWIPQSSGTDICRIRRIGRVTCCQDLERLPPAQRRSCGSSSVSHIGSAALAEGWKDVWGSHMKHVAFRITDQLGE